LVEEHEGGELVSRSLGIAPGSGWSYRSFRSRVRPPMHYLALCKGDLDQREDGPPIAVRAQRAQVLGDVFGLASDDSGRRLRAAIRQIERAGRGVFLYVLGPRFDGLDRALALGGDPPTPGLRPRESGFREFGLGAQVLKSLGIRRIRVMTNHARKIIGLEGFGIEVVGSVPLEDG
jgi:3,4-dihydroxy 2-butanone 4-phosphate synthase/GTP cyclohydrolase II